MPRDPDSGWPLPLRLGARADVLCRFGGVLPPERLVRLLGAWVRSSSYLTALAKAGAWRHDLDGRPVEPVSCEHRARAGGELTERQRHRRIAEQGAGR